TGITASVANEVFSQHTGQATQEKQMRVSPTVGVISRETSYDSLSCFCGRPSSAQCPATTLARVFDGRRRVGPLHDLGVCVCGTPRISDVTRPPGSSVSRPTPRLVRHCYGHGCHRHHLLPPGSTLGRTL